MARVISEWVAVLFAGAKRGCIYGRYGIEKLYSLLPKV